VLARKKNQIPLPFFATHKNSTYLIPKSTTFLVFLEMVDHFGDEMEEQHDYIQIKHPFTQLKV